MSKTAATGQAYPSKLDPTPVTQEKAKEIPAKATPESVVQTPKVPALVTKDRFLHLGDYKISTRADSGYRILYRVVAAEGQFEAVDKAWDSTEPSDKDKAKKLLEKMFVPIEQVEQAMRNDPQWRLHCERKLAKLKARAADGDKSAQRTIENKARVKSGEWVGDIREMISTCNGSASPNADNRNINKFKDAKLAFMMHPKRPKKGETAAVAIFPLRHLDKVKKAIQVVYSA